MVDSACGAHSVPTAIAEVQTDAVVHCPLPAHSPTLQPNFLGVDRSFIDANVPCLLEDDFGLLSKAVDAAHPIIDAGDAATEDDGAGSVSHSVTSSHELLTVDDGYSTDQKEPGISVECQTDVTGDLLGDGVADYLDVTLDGASSSSPVDSGIQTDVEKRDACGVQTSLLDSVDELLERSVPAGPKSSRRSFGLSDEAFRVQEELCRQLERNRMEYNEAVQRNMELGAAEIVARVELDHLRGRLERAQKESEVRFPQRADDVWKCMEK